MFTSPDNHQHKALQAVLDHTTSSQNEEHAKSDRWNICENPERGRYLFSSILSTN